MASRFANVVLIQMKTNDDFMLFQTMVLAYKGEVEKIPGSVVIDTVEGLFNPMAKIAIEPSKTDSSKYFHLRMLHNNRYLSRNNATDGFIVAVSKTPVEDKAKAECTLFEADAADANSDFNLIHVQSGGRVVYRKADSRVLVTLEAEVDGGLKKKVSFVDAETVVKLPTHVAFKGDNKMYLQGVTVWDHPYLKFSSDDPNRKASGHTVTLLPSGEVRIRSDYYEKFWRNGDNWIWADTAADKTEQNWGTYFRPVKLDDKTIALKNARNGLFCGRLSAENNYDCLNAFSSTTAKETRLEVEELVSERKIHDVSYRIDDSRISGETPYVAGEAQTANNTGSAGNMEVEIEYKVESSYHFSSSLSISAGVSATVTAGIPEIASASVTVSAEVTVGLEFGTTKDTSVTVKTKVSIPVPAHKVYKVKYVGTKGTCNVPFSYIARDKSSTDGSISENKLVDGIFTGVNSYNFHAVLEDITPK